MASNLYSTGITAGQTFQDWLDRTNAMGQQFTSVVTLGGAEQNNLGDIYVTGNLRSENTVLCNTFTPHTGLDITLDALVTTKTQTIRVPKGGDSASIQFQYFEDQGDENTLNDSYIDTWRIGPNNDSHAIFQIIGANATSGQPETELTIEQSVGDLASGTPGLLTGTNIVIDATIMPSDIAAYTSQQWLNSRTVTFAGGDVTGSFSIQGNADVADVVLTLGSGIAGNITSFELGSGLLGTNADDVAVTTIENGMTVGHYTPSTVATNVTDGQAITGITFDAFGHVKSVSKTDLGKFVVENPASDAARSTIQGNGLKVASNVELAFGRDTNTLGEAHIKYQKAASATGDTMQINATCPGLLLTATDNIQIGKLIEAGGGIIAKLKIDTATGSLISEGDLTAFGSASDKSLKENIEPIENALDKVCSISGYTFNYIDSPEKGRLPGVIAQELEQVLPEAVYETPDGKKAVRYDNTVALLIEAIKELQQQVQDLKNNK